MAKIDLDLYSRQIGAYGLEAMGKLMQLRVAITGLNGVGAECAKNLILAGPRGVQLHDPVSVAHSDLGNSFCLSEGDVGKNRAEASLNYLSNLNSYVHVGVLVQPEIDENCLSSVDCLVVCDGSFERLRMLGDLCRKNGVSYIVGMCAGLGAFAFCDFGEVFMCRDPDGEEPKEAIIAGITNENPGVVFTHSERLLGFSSGDFVRFKEVQGDMKRINEMKPVQIKMTSKHSFSICDTSSFPIYTGGGIAYQVKMPITIAFKTFSESVVAPIAKGEQMLIVPDLGKFGRSEQLHFAFMALLKLRDEAQAFPIPHPIEYCPLAFAREATAAVAARIKATAAVQRAQQIARTLLEQAKVEVARDAACGCVLVDSLDLDIIEKVVRYSPCLLSPMCSFIGGIIAQEVVKLTGKYSPLKGFLYTDAFECFPPDSKTALNTQHVLAFDKIPDLLQWRFADSCAMLGLESQLALASSNVFVVGAGALGCDLLKNFALLGVATDLVEGETSCKTGVLTLTDMDRIEVSNLNRQFLFRREHVGKPKSTTAATAAVRMQPHMHVHALEKAVGMETEATVFNDEFWKGQDIIVNALDNIKARQYVDSRCVAFCLPLLESGTLGTKANVQVILPHMTQCYSDSVDPPEESIPLCTLRHFPHAFEHVVEWARDVFEGMFSNKINEAHQFQNDKATYILKVKSEGTLSTQLDRLLSIQDALAMYKTDANGLAIPPTFEDCVSKSVNLFQELFFNKIAQLLNSFPIDHRTSSGDLFWTPPKRPPTATPFDPDNENHIQFVFAAANLLAAAYNVAQVSDRVVVHRMARNVVPMKFEPREMTIKVDEEKEGKTPEPEVNSYMMGTDDLERLIAIEAELVKINNVDSMVFVPVEFEKDDDTNHHVDFVHACACARAANYNIELNEKHKTKSIAGRIIPAIATTTSMITGLVSLEFIKCLQMRMCKYPRKLDDFKNAFVNLALPLWLFSEPMPPNKTVDKDFDPVAGGPVRALPKGFTCWDKVEIDKPKCTVGELCSYLEEKFDVNVDILSVGNYCLYNSFVPAHRKQRIDRPVVELVEQLTKTPAQSRVFIESSCNSKKDSVDVLLPTISIEMSNKP